MGCGLLFTGRHPYILSMTRIKSYQHLKVLRSVKVNGLFSRQHSASSISLVVPLINRMREKKSMPCKLSVITPVFNGSRFIEFCIRNVIEQNRSEEHTSELQ